MTFLLALVFLISALAGGVILLWMRASRPAEGLILTGKVLVIRVPKANEKDALAAEQMFASLHGLLKLTPELQEHFTFEIVSSSSGIYFYTWVPTQICDFVKSQIFAQYPNAEINEAEDYSSKISDLGMSVSAARLNLSREQYLPIKTFPDFKVDPLAAITGALSETGKDEEIWVQILLRPVPDVWQNGGYRYVEALRSGTSLSGFSFSGLLKDLVSEVTSIISEMPRYLFNPESIETAAKKKEEKRVELSMQQQGEVASIELKLTKMGFQSAVRVIALAATPERSETLLRGTTASFKQYSTANLNSFQAQEVDDLGSFLEDYRQRVFPSDWAYVLNTEELASVFHLPNVSVETPMVAWSHYKKGEPPLNLPISGDDVTFFAKTTFRDRLIKFGIKAKDRARHLYVIGKTGTGKTTLFENMIIQDMRSGEGVGVIDPHGESIEKLLDFVPENRIDDVVLFDPSDRDFPFGFNMLELKDPEKKSLVASGLVDVFRKRFEFSWGPRLEHILRNCILTLLDVPNTTLLGVNRLLQDRNYRNYIVYKVKDPVIRRFWEEEFKGMMANQSLVSEAIAPIQNRLGQFLSSPVVRNIVGQARSSFDLGEVMNEGKIFLVNLSKGRIGLDDSSILGSMLVSRMQFEAMRRVEIPEEERRNFYLYVDEFQNFASGAFASILSEARKYHLCLSLTHQYIAQLPEEMRDAVFGNVGTIVSFAISSQDAAVIAAEFAPVFTQEDLISLEKYNTYLELMIDGMASSPFSAVTLEPPQDKVGKRQEVIDRSRARYGRSREKVEQAVQKWSESVFDLGTAKAEESHSGDAAGPEIASQDHAEVVP